LASAAEGTDVVTLAVGGNDVDSSAVVSHRTLGESACRSALAVALERGSTKTPSDEGEYRRLHIVRQCPQLSDTRQRAWRSQSTV
jgi:hypothetical protein